MNRVSKIAIVAGLGLSAVPLASAALPPTFLFGPPRGVIIWPPVAPWVPIEPGKIDPPPVIDVPDPDSRTPDAAAAIHASAPPPEPLPYPGHGQAEES